MTYHEFIKNIQADCTAFFPADTSIQFKKIMKNNGVELDSLIVFEPGSRVAPTIYLDRYYKDYLAKQDYAAIRDRIFDEYRENKRNVPFEPRCFKRFENVQSQIAFKLVHTEKNKRLLSQIPAIGYLDLSIVFYLLYAETGDCTASILITDDHLKLWGKTKDELFAYAAENTPRLLPVQMTDIREIAAEYAEYEEPPHSPANVGCGDIPMFVLTNERRYLGACSVLYPNVLKDFAQSLSSDLYVLPSSIHEVIVVPSYVGRTKDELDKMVREVNAAQLADNEILSDHVYYFSRSQAALSM